MIEYLVQALNAAKVFAAKNDIRYYLNGVALHIENNKITSMVANNGHCGIIIGKETVTDNPVVVGNANLKLLEIALESLEVGAHIRDDYTICVDHMTLVINDYRIPLVDGRYPNINRVTPKKNRSPSGEWVIGLSPEYLSMIDKAKKQLSKHLPPRGRIGVNALCQFGSSSEPMRVNFTSDKIDDTVIMIMPVRL